MRIELYKLRCSNLLNQKEMAEILGLTQPAYSQIEKGISNGNKSVWLLIKYKFGLTEEELEKVKRVD